MLLGMFLAFELSPFCPKSIIDSFILIKFIIYTLRLRKLYSHHLTKAGRAHDLTPEEEDPEEETIGWCCQRSPYIFCEHNMTGAIFETLVLDILYVHSPTPAEFCLLEHLGADQVIQKRKPVVQSKDEAASCYKLKKNH